MFFKPVWCLSALRVPDPPSRSLSALSILNPSSRSLSALSILCPERFTRRELLDIELGVSILNLDGRKEGVEGDPGSEPGLIANLALALGGQKSLFKLELSNMSLGAEGAAVLGPCVAGLGNSLQHLNLSNNRLMNAGAGYFAKAIGALTCLEVLDVGGNDIGEKGARILAAGLVNCKRLACLRTSGNLVGDAGMIAISQALEHTVRDSKERVIVWPIAMNMTELDVTRNGIGPEGCAVLSNVMKSHCARMTKLVLKGNSLTANGTEYHGVHLLGKSLMKMTLLEHLNLTDCSLTAEGAQAVVTGLLEKERLASRTQTPIPAFLVMPSMKCGGTPSSSFMSPKTLIRNALIPQNKNDPRVTACP